jgi:class 3 adenylate cyclase
MVSWLIVVAAQIPSALLWSVVFNSVQLLVQKRLLEQSLAFLYLSRNGSSNSLNAADLLKPGAEKHLLTIIFSDIENFTAISEGMDSDDLAALMNKYFETAVSHCIHKTDGTVVKYIGDAIFAFWNAPEQQVDHQERACQAALLFRDQVVSFSKAGKVSPCARALAFTPASRTSAISAARHASITRRSAKVSTSPLAWRV